MLLALCPLMRALRAPRTALVLSAVASLGAVACDEEFDSKTQLSGYRVLGIQADPPELDPEGTLSLTAHDYTDGSEPITYRYRLCPYSFGSASDYECEVEEIELADGRQGVIEADLGGQEVDLRARLRAVSGDTDADGTPRSLERGLDVWVKLLSGPDCEGCDEIRTVKRIVIRELGQQPPNENPLVGQLEVEGELRAGETITLRVEPPEPERYEDSMTGEELTEDFLYTWYTTLGEVDPPLTFGDDSQTELELPEDAAELEVAVAIRDGRGGLALARRTLTVEP